MGSRIRLLGKVALIAGLACLVSAGILYLVVQKSATLAEVLMVVGAALCAVSVLVDPGKVRKVLPGRVARYGGSVTVLVLAFIVIVGTVNFLSASHHARFDLTENLRFTLSEQTVDLLARLEEPVDFKAFYSQTDPRRQAVEGLLEEYAFHSDLITYELVDPNLRPSIAREYDVLASAVVVLEAGGERREVYDPQEQDITSALLRLSREEEKTICFLTGHNERNVDSSEPDGYSVIKSSLESDGYLVRTVNLALTGTVPDPCDVVVVAAPRKPLLEEERRFLRGYLLKAGKGLILREPEAEEDLAKLLEPWSVGFGAGIIVDPESALLGDLTTPAVTRYVYGQITKNLPMTLFPTATYVRQLEGPPALAGVQSTMPLMETGEESWAETALEEERLRYDKGADEKGPLNLGMTMEAPGSLGSEEYKTARSTVTRLVLIGDSDFAANVFVEMVGNRDLFLNAVNWLAEEEELITIRPKPLEDRQLYLTGSQARWILYFSTLGLPVLILTVGGVVWWKRR